MTETQQDERLARRVSASEDRQRPRANPEDEHDAVRPNKCGRMMLRIRNNFGSSYGMTRTCFVFFFVDGIVAAS